MYAAAQDPRLTKVPRRREKKRNCCHLSAVHFAEGIAGHRRRPLLRIFAKCNTTAAEMSRHHAGRRNNTAVADIIEENDDGVELGSHDNDELLAFNPGIVVFLNFFTGAARFSAMTAVMSS